MRRPTPKGKKMKYLPNIIAQEKSSCNSTHVPAYAGKNNLLMKYLDSEKFLADLEKARLEKAEVSR
jgi:hypothetical protein